MLLSLHCCHIHYTPFFFIFFPIFLSNPYPLFIFSFYFPFPAFASLFSHMVPILMSSIFPLLFSHSRQLYPWILLYLILVYLFDSLSFSCIFSTSRCLSKPRILICITLPLRAFHEDKEKNMQVSVAVFFAHDVKASLNL